MTWCLYERGKSLTTFLNRTETQDMNEFMTETVQEKEKQNRITKHFTEIRNWYLLKCKKKKKGTICGFVFTLLLQTAHTTAPTSGADSRTDKHLLQGKAQGAWDPWNLIGCFCCPLPESEGERKLAWMDYWTGLLGTVPGPLITFIVGTKCTKNMYINHEETKHN